VSGSSLGRCSSQTWKDFMEVSIGSGSGLEAACREILEERISLSESGGV
jgi:hypothetical protein